MLRYFVGTQISHPIRRDFETPFSSLPPITLFSVVYASLDSLIQSNSSSFFASMPWADFLFSFLFYWDVRFPSCGLIFFRFFTGFSIHLFCLAVISWLEKGDSFRKISFLISKYVSDSFLKWVSFKARLKPSPLTGVSSASR